MRTRTLTLILAVSAIGLATVAGTALAGKSGGGGGKGGQVLSCDQAPAGGKAPLDSKYVKSTADCFDNVEATIKAGSSALSGAASGCSGMTDPARDSYGIALGKVAKSGLDQDAKTKKARAGYFKKESEYYGDKGKRKVAGQIDDVTDAIGKASFEADGYWTAVAGAASAFRNNDCSEVSAKAAEGASAVGKYDTELTSLKAALKKLP